MARIETDPNYTTPTFPRATAATDPFKKEDVQLVAAALSTHVHDGVHGLVLTTVPIGAIADGSITSAKIADKTIVATDIADLTITQAQLAVGSVDSSKIVDGTIASADLGSNCVTNRGFAVGATNNPTTTSTSFVDLTDMLVSVTLDTAADLVVELSGPFSASASGIAITIAVQLDGGSDVGQVFGYSPGATLPQVISTRWVFAGLGAGTHSIRGRWATASGTATANNIGRTLTAVAYKH